MRLPVGELAPSQALPQCDALLLAAIRGVRELIAERGRQTPIIAKIERHEALENIEGIVAAADGIMVARGDLVADIVRSTTGAQASLVNGGSLRTGLNKGEVTFRQIYAALPFNSYLVAVKMSGKLLLETLEHGVSGVERGEGRFPQVSGITFVFDRRRLVGRRIVSATVGGQPIDPQQEYSVATLDFIAAGGDGYTAFGQAIRSGGDFVEIGGAMRSSRLVYNDSGQFLRDVVLDALAKDSPVAPVVDGRIVEEK